MKVKGEITRISTSEHTLEQILEEIKGVAQTQTVGIVLFGADCELKYWVYMQLIEQISNLFTEDKYFGILSADTTEEIKKYKQNVLVVMSGVASSNCDHWAWATDFVRNAGAEIVIGIYAKFYPLMRTTEVMLQGGTAEDKQAWVLLNHPPNADGLDYFIVVEEDKEG